MSWYRNFRTILESLSLSHNSPRLECIRGERNPMSSHPVSLRSINFVFPFRQSLPVYGYISIQDKIIGHFPLSANTLHLLATTFSSVTSTHAFSLFFFPQTARQTVTPLHTVSISYTHIVYSFPFRTFLGTLNTFLVILF